ncbi:LysR family transcriptional regulator [Saccharopolyspora rosea]|uniref:LysR substrate-binding domain-containing protein n=1 Tax=Saccharopolyspora rosea TaxID=524884 RepID=A0ABW3G0I0_9PSEU|nr:LysR substrate-binding domain-containing protein [Saccharopolyspora rosea]
MGLDLRVLEQLIALAEERSFTRAARRVHLTQQALSTSIRGLEREVGVQLVDRSGGRVRLLPAGEALVADARVLRGLANAALHRTRSIGRDGAETVRIGHTPAVTGEEVTALLARVRAEHPDLRCDVRQFFPDALRAGLGNGELDLGLCRAMTPPAGLNSTTVCHHRLRVAVSSTHRLAERGTVGFADLADECLVVWGVPGRSGYTDLLLGLCRDAGIEPRFERNPVQGTPPVTAVIGTEHVALVTSAPGPAADGRVVVCELDPAVHVPLRALWPEHTTSPARDALLESAAR